MLMIAHLVQKPRMIKYVEQALLLGRVLFMTTMKGTLDAGLIMTFMYVTSF